MITRIISGIAAGSILLALVVTGPALAQYDEPCIKCGYEGGANPNWVEDCPGPLDPPAEANIDNIPNSTVTVGIDLPPFDCTPDTVVVFKGPFDIWRDAPVGGQITMHIEEMDLDGPGGTTLIAGEGLGQGGVLPPSPGLIQQTDPQFAEASLNVFFEIDLGAETYGYNHEPLVLTAVDFTCIPPDVVFGAASDECLDVYDTPIAGGEVIAKITFTGADIPPEHDAYTAIPTVSQWGVSILALLVLTAGTVVIVRRRKATA